MPESDPMDQRLREYAARWHDIAAPPPAPDVVRLRTGRRSTRPWWLAAMSAAAVAAVILGGTQLLGDDSDRHPPEPPGTTKSTGTTEPGHDVVPWAALPATHPRLPNETTPPSPDPAEAVGKPPCRAADLRATSTGGAAAGTYVRTVRLALVGNTPCRLEGYPDLVLLDRGVPVDIPLVRDSETSTYRHPVLVSPGHPALLRLGWTSDWCAPPVHNDEIRITLSGGSLTVPGLGGSRCYGTPGSGTRAPIVVEPYQPVTWHDAKVRSAYAAVDVGGTLDLTATAGAPVDFTVTLTSPEDLVLDPCPDFRIVQTDTAPHEETYALNCAAVPYRDGHGRPYLPAGTPVTFAMRTTAGPPAAYKLSWELDTVDVKGVSGTLTVADAPSSTGSPTADPTDAADPKTVQAGVAVIQAFLDTWRRNGLALATRRYLDADSQLPPSATGLPRITSGKVVRTEVFSWESRDRFTLYVSLDLHFSGDRMAWDEGENGRFVTVTRSGGAFRLAFATSP